jgi:hypothetical protein
VRRRMAGRHPGSDTSSRGDNARAPGRHAQPPLTWQPAAVAAGAARRRRQPRRRLLLRLLLPQDLLAAPPQLARALSAAVALAVGEAGLAHGLPSQREAAVFGAPHHAAVAALRGGTAAAARSGHALRAASAWPGGARAQRRQLSQRSQQRRQRGRPGSGPAGRTFFSTAPSRSSCCWCHLRARRSGRMGAPRSRCLREYCEHALHSSTWGGGGGAGGSSKRQSRRRASLTERHLATAAPSSQSSCSRAAEANMGVLFLPLRRGAGPRSARAA